MSKVNLVNLNQLNINLNSSEIFYLYSNQDEFATPTGRVKQRKDRKDETTVDDFVNEKLSKQILTQARLQMQDLHRETVGEPSAKKLPKLGDNLDSDEDDV